MTSLIESYEQQYSVLTAEITSEIGKLKRMPEDGDKRELIRTINGSIDEGKELLEQMSLEIQDVDSSTKASFVSRLNCYQAELKRLTQDFQNAKNETQIQLYDSSDFDEFTTSGISSEQQRRLLDNSERIERTGNRLTEGYKTILETERIGTAVLQDLSSQRETLQKSRSRLREANEDLRQSSRIMNSMIMRSLRERAVLFGVIIIFIVVVFSTLYYAITH
ncbi:vesicle transport through interaction with t-SNAREs homolog 1A [Contarinia nasturtii]|uniref:vesicle transport through interaction with t-SNAREs homolog 1A n=1 Tax=Contarinia nasturtii TaxID=265458 RepID=UPI0012D46E3C|nr:vesicle transport through interaction with t-SNAREs homolog 1A [Contarinia nasturtii]